MNQYDGGGQSLAPFFISHIKSLNKNFSVCFEWCAGPGYIGRALLNEGLCDSLVLADINEDSLHYGFKNFPYSKAISYHVSDNLKDITPTLHGSLDLVVGNPPNYFNISSQHPIGKYMQDDLRPNDRGWEIHKDFYSNIKVFLSNKATMVIHEICPFDKLVFINSEIPYDSRPDKPISAFYDMIDSSGLDLVSVTRSDKSVGGYFLTISNERW